MKRQIIRALSIAAVMLIVSVFSAVYAKPNATAVERQGIKIATWNMEHFSVSDTQGCRVRTEAELDAMEDYAATVDADIFALQEVASESALRRIFPATSWRIYMSARPDSTAYECRENGMSSTQQKVAIVTKKSVQVSGVRQHSDISVSEPGLRYGVEVEVNTTGGVLSVLAVHLKSGCFVDDYQRDDGKSCSLLGRQVPHILQWIDEHETSHLPYVLLGDFNHRLSAPYNRFTRDINEHLSSDSKLVLATRDLIGCHPWYPAPIDHIWVGGMDTNNIASQAQMWRYINMEPEAMLSDHCAVSVTLPVN